jgi:RNA polymerase sigma factor (sigma-70 family)
MATNRLGDVLQHLRKLNARQSVGNVEDSLLLERFVNNQDEAAFEELLGRHGPMVLDVCRRVLHDPAAVDDAFQATFLVLVRKAASIRKTELLANWLYGVAYRTAARARVDVVKRRARESAVPARQAVDPLDEMTARELFAVLDEELNALPSQYRAPLVLCYLENRTRDEAAQQSGCSLSTLDRLLERGRALLKARMVRRGLTVGLALSPALLSQVNASGCVASSLAASTVKATAFVASGGAASSVVSPSVTFLVEGVLKTMFITKLKKPHLFLRR